MVWFTTQTGFQEKKLNSVLICYTLLSCEISHFDSSLRWSCLLPQWPGNEFGFEHLWWITEDEVSLCGGTKMSERAKIEWFICVCVLVRSVGWLMVAVRAGPHFWVDWSHSTWANTRQKTVELSTTKNRKSDTLTRARARTPRKYTCMLCLLQSQTTHMHTTPHPQTHFPISSAWRSTCQLLPVAEKDGLCWFCEAHRQDPPGDCRSPAAQTSALFTSPHKQSVFYTASLYQRSMHYRTAIEQEIKLGDRYLAEENEPVWSSLTTYTTRTIKYHTCFLINLLLHTLPFPPTHSNLPHFFSVFLPFLSSSISFSSSARFALVLLYLYETKHPNGCLNSLRYVSLGTTSLWQGTLAGNWDHYKGKIGDIFLPLLLCLFIFLSWSLPHFSVYFLSLFLSRCKWRIEVCSFWN